MVKVARRTNVARNDGIFRMHRGRKTDTYDIVYVRNKAMLKDTWVFIISKCKCYVNSQRCVTTYHVRNEVFSVTLLVRVKFTPNSLIPMYLTIASDAHCYVLFD